MAALTPSVLVVDDEEPIRKLIVAQLKRLGLPCQSSENGVQALEALRANPSHCVVVSDINMPHLTGLQLLREVKQHDETIQVVFISGRQDVETLRECLQEGACDYLAKPFELEDLSIAVGKALEKHSLLRENIAYRQDLERMVRERTQDVIETRDIALFTLAKLVESRDGQTGRHLERIAAYSRRLATELVTVEGFEIDREFIQQIDKSSPLHDIGKVGIPDSVLLKPGRLSDQEFEVMKTHAQIGGDTLRTVVKRYERHDFLVMAMEIAYNHHEKWDGGGYPRGISGEEIPLSARIVALADAYDAITSERPYKEALSHEEAQRRIAKDRGTHFDPNVVDAFLACQDDIASARERFAG